VVSLKFTLPGDRTALELKGEIVHVGSKATDLGMGVRFVELQAPEKERIEAYAERLEAPPSTPNG
jgi:hypothetical protein